MNPYMLNEYLDIHEIASLSVTGSVLKGKAYSSNNEIRELERKLLKAVKEKEINAKTYPLYNVSIFLYKWFNYFPKGCRIMMRPVDVAELYKKWGYVDMCFNTEETPQPKSAPVLSKIPWITYENTFAELVSVLWNKGYIEADSYSDALKKTAPHFTVNSDIDVLRAGLGQKLKNGGLNFDSIPEAGEEGKECFSDIKPARTRINKG